MKRSYTKLLRRIHSSCQQHGYTLEILGKIGRHNFVRVIHEPKNWQRSIVIVATVHGDETGATEGLIRCLEEGIQSSTVRVVMYPVMNISGYIHDTRKDAEGFDLNRTKGNLLRPPQTLLFTSLITEPVDCFISMHEDSRISGKCCYGFGFNRQYKNFYQGLLEAMGLHMKVFQKEKLDGLTVEGGIIWDRFDTSLEARFAEAGIVRCFCSETGSRGNFQQRVDTNVALLKEATSLIC